MTEAGHNSDAIIRSFIERVEHLEEEKKALLEDIRGVYKEAKDVGFDTKIMREVVKLRRLSAADRAERQALLDLYMKALGMLADTPLGQAALSRVA